MRPSVILHQWREARGKREERNEGDDAAILIKSLVTEVCFWTLVQEA
ncbi:hypothetical protein RHIZ404_170031 [Rhizobium sp. EC-SD404]|nr:hypothetical protein RHIZ404_170031 [Rhizobium sp. EC-SD404]